MFGGVRKRSNANAHSTTFCRRVTINTAAFQTEIPGILMYDSDICGLKYSQDLLQQTSKSSLFIIK